MFLADLVHSDVGPVALWLLCTKSARNIADYIMLYYLIKFLVDVLYASIA